MAENEIDEGALISFGGEVKAIAMDDGSVKLGGYLVRFGDATQPDLTGDYFTAQTDYGDALKSHGWFNHRMAVNFAGKSVSYKDELQEVALKKDDIGIFAEIVIKARNEYEKIIADLGKAGKLCWSSGTANHLVDKKQLDGGVAEITRWILGLDASLTPIPAEPRNRVAPVKSLLVAEAETVGTVDDAKLINTEKKKMEDTELQALLEKTADEAVKRFAASQPQVKAGFDVDVSEDEADRALKGNPFKSNGEYLFAVKNAGMPSGTTDKRLLPLKATGLNEAIPSQGGFLVPPEMASGILQHMWQTGSMLSRFNPIKVSGNGMTFNAIDETSRATGSRFGGVTGYWLAEAGAKTASKPKFRQVELKLKKLAALCYATDELLEDQTALESWLNTYVPQELRFMAEDAIMNGNGVGKPLGILNSPALLSVARTDATEVDVYDIARMWSGRYPGVNDYVWFINSTVFPQLINMAVGNFPVYMPPGGVTGSPYATIFGRPVIETEYNPALGTAGDILLASPSQYAIIDKGGVQSASSIHVLFVYDETAFRFVYRVDGEPAWNSKVARFSNASDYISPFVVLAAST